MRFNIYGKFVIEVVWSGGRWCAYRAGDGTRRPEQDLIIPANLQPEELLAYLEDIYHEYASPGRSIAVLDE